MQKVITAPNYTLIVARNHADYSIFLHKNKLDPDDFIFIDGMEQLFTHVDANPPLLILADSRKRIDTKKVLHIIQNSNFQFYITTII